MQFWNNWKSTKAELWAGSLLFGVFVLAYYPTLVLAVNLWIESEASILSSGLLVTVCCLYLLYSRRGKFSALTPNPNYWFALPLFGFGLVWLFGNLVDVQKLQLVTIPLLLLAVIGLVAGWQYFQLAFAPVCILFFALPLWDPLLAPLQDLTTFVTEWNVKLVGRPVFVQGNILQLPGGAFFVDTSCAGLRFLLVSSILCIVYTCLNPLPLSVALRLYMTAILLSLVANWIRVITVVLIGDATNMQSSLVYDHVNFGWIVYLLLVLVPLFFIAERATSKLSIPNSQTRTSNIQDFDFKNFSLASLFAFALLVVGPLSNAVITVNESAFARPVAIPDSTAAWTLTTNRPATNAENWRPAFAGFDERLFGTYANNSIEVELHIYHYSNQAQNREVVNALNRIADDEIWRSVSGAANPIRIPDANQSDLRTVLEERISRSRTDQIKLVWYWYRVGGTNTVNDLDAKLLQFTESFQGRTDANLIAIATDCDYDCQDESATLSLFLQDMLVAIEANL